MARTTESEEWPKKKRKKQTDLKEHVENHVNFRTERQMPMGETLES